MKNDLDFSIAFTQVLIAQPCSDLTEIYPFKLPISPRWNSNFNHSSHWNSKYDRMYSWITFRHIDMVGLHEQYKKEHRDLLIIVLSTIL